MRSKGISGIYRGLGATLLRYCGGESQQILRHDHYGLVVCHISRVFFKRWFYTSFLFLARDVPFSCIYFPLFAYLRLEVSEETRN